MMFVGVVGIHRPMIAMLVVVLLVSDVPLTVPCYYFPSRGKVIHHRS